jgi:hypothetical protein
MDEMIRTTFYEPNLDIFDAYPDISTDLKEEIEHWKRDFKLYCEECKDIATFSSSYFGSDLHVQAQDLITKAAMEAYMTPTSGDASENIGTSDAATGIEQNDIDDKSQIISVREFVEQYKPVYDEIKKAGYRIRGEKAYKNLFAVADRTDDMVEAHIIMEEERLLWKIVSEDSLDIFETILEAMDPL